MALRMGVSGPEGRETQFEGAAPLSREPPRAAVAGGFSSARSTESCPEALAFLSPVVEPQPPSPSRLARQWSPGGLGSVDQGLGCPQCWSRWPGDRPSLARRLWLAPPEGLRALSGWVMGTKKGSTARPEAFPTLWWPLLPPPEHVPRPVGTPRRTVPATTCHSQWGGAPRPPGHLVQQAERLSRAHSSSPRSHTEPRDLTSAQEQWVCPAAGRRAPAAASLFPPLRALCTESGGALCPASPTPSPRILGGARVGAGCMRASPPGARGYRSDGRALCAPSTCWAVPAWASPALLPGPWTRRPVRERRPRGWPGCRALSAPPWGIGSPLSSGGGGARVLGRGLAHMAGEVRGGRLSGSGGLRDVAH